MLALMASYVSGVVTAGSSGATGNRKLRFWILERGQNDERKWVSKEFFFLLLFFLQTACSFVCVFCFYHVMYCIYKEFFVVALLLTLTD